jgi:gliding motility-associated-like protein
MVSNTCSSGLSNIVQLIGFENPANASSILLVYNAVAPNGNGKHEFFKIENIELFANNRVEIYNKWGEKVFEITGYDNQISDLRFEGRSNVGSSKELNEGTYYYLISTEGSRQNGYLHLKR